ncbi:hypothetical protein Tco_0250328 [Tanacetum coccineum]
MYMEGGVGKDVPQCWRELRSVEILRIRDTCDTNLTVNSSTIVQNPLQRIIGLRRHEAEAVSDHSPGIDNDIYSTVSLSDAFLYFNNNQNGQRCVDTCEAESELKTVLLSSFFDNLKQHQNEVNEIREERLARTTNPLALVAQNTTLFTSSKNHSYSNHPLFLQTDRNVYQNSGKQLLSSSAPTYDPEPATVTEDEEMSKEQEIDQTMALISFVQENLTTSQPTPTFEHHQNTSRNQAKSTQEINRWNWEYGHVSREWIATDDESEEQEFGSTNMYMDSIHEVTSRFSCNSGPIFDDEPMHRQNTNGNSYCVCHGK